MSFNLRAFMDSICYFLLMDRTFRNGIYATISCLSSSSVEGLGFKWLLRIDYDNSLNRICSLAESYGYGEYLLI